MAMFEPRQSRNHKLKQPIFAESSRYVILKTTNNHITLSTSFSDIWILLPVSSSPEHRMADTGNPPGSVKQTPPKDFVCPITSNVFDDPVTLETGQTYERK